MPSYPPDRAPDAPQPLREVLDTLGLNGSIEGDVLSFLQHRIRDVIYVLEVTPPERYRFVYVNAAFEATTGIPPSAVVGKFVEEVIPPESVGLVRSKCRQAIDSGEDMHWDEVSNYPTGTRVGEVTVTPVPSADGSCATLIGTVHDVTERHQAQERLAELEERSRLALEAAGAGSFDWHADGNRVFLSGQCRRILGHVSESFLLDMGALGRFVHPDDLPRVAATLEQVRAGAAPTFVAELRARHLYGHWVWLRCQGRAVIGGGGAVSRVFGVYSDITLQKEAEDLLWRQANFDSLTGLPNRHLFLERLRQAIRHTNQGEHPEFSLLYIDLDQFKQVNDTLGHSVGDQLLKEAAGRLLRCTRDTDTVSRIGGDEFTVLLADTRSPGKDDRHVIERLAGDIIGAMSQPFHIEGETLYVSASIGVTHFPGDGTDADSLLKHADQAMYAAKHLGRNRFAHFSPAMQARAQDRRRMSDDLRLAIGRGELQVYYQPIVELGTGNIVKAEALLRWRHPARGWISPVEFIPLAEDTGLIFEIGEWVFRTVVTDTARWVLEQGRALQVGVNVSPLQIAKGGASFARCMDFLASHALPRHAIVVEVTEGSLLQHDHTVEERLRELEEHGVALALDDFGTGYSSLSYLQQYRFEFLKIDRAFVGNMKTGSRQLALCKTIIAMAHTLDMRVISEGIGKAHEAELLRHAGCDYGQGFFFHRPMPAGRFEQLLHARDTGSPALR